MSDNGNTSNNPPAGRLPPQLERMLERLLGRSLGGMSNIFRSESILTPEAVENVLIPGLNSDLLAAGKPRLTENEMQALINDNQLAGAVFNGRLRESIIAGKASVAGLTTLLPEARELLRYGYMQEALNKGAITLEDLSKLDSNALVQAQNLVAIGNFDRKTEAGENNFRELTGLLRLPQDREGSLDSAFDTVRERTRVVNTGSAKDSLPSHSSLPDSGHGNVR